VLIELSRMETSAEFEPSYLRFLLDWEDWSGPVGKLLSELAYHRSVPSSEGGSGSLPLATTVLPD